MRRRSFPLLLLAAGALLLLAAESVRSQSPTGQTWPRFRGPNGQGLAKADPEAIPLKWTLDDCAWRIELPGMGYSSPVIAERRVVITSADPDKATQWIICLNAATGKELWKTTFASTPHPKHSFNSYASTTPALADGRVFHTTATPEHYLVIALALEDGEELWRRDLGPFVAQHGFGASAIVFDDLVIVPNQQDADSAIVALDAATGKIRWTAPRRTDMASYSTPCLFQPTEGRIELITTSTAHGVSSLDPRTGKSNWEWAKFEQRAACSPAITSGLVVATCGIGGAGRQCVAIRPGGSADDTPAELAYEVTDSLPYVPCPLAVGDLLFLWYDRGVVTCLDGPSGKIHWRERVEGSYFGSPIHLNGRIYCISREGELVVLAASDEFRPLARIDLGEPSHSTPAVADGRLFIRTISHLMAVGEKKGDADL